MKNHRVANHVNTFHWEGKGPSRERADTGRSGQIAGWFMEGPKGGMEKAAFPG